MDGSPLVTVNDLSFRYQGAGPWTLKNIQLEINAGEWVAIIGHNGSGKSTLAKCLNGLLVPEDGHVDVKGYQTNHDSDVWEIRSMIGMVFQNPDNQFVGTSVQDDIVFGMENRGFSREVMAQRLDEVLEDVNMKPFINQEPHRLSGGQKQRIAIAGILATRPDVIVLDEATSMLDPKGRQDVIDTVTDLRQQRGMTVISITHDLEETLKADRIIVMNDGEVLMEGSPGDIYQKADLLEEIGLDLPFSIKMKDGLIKRGVPVPSNLLTSEELVDALWTSK